MTAAAIGGGGAMCRSARCPALPGAGPQPCAVQHCGRHGRLARSSAWPVASQLRQLTAPAPPPALPPAPQDALHGDIGIISPQDLLVCFSKSGATEEILRLVPFARVGKGEEREPRRGCSLKGGFRKWARPLAWRSSPALGSSAQCCSRAAAGQAGPPQLHSSALPRLPGPALPARRPGATSAAKLCLSSSPPPETHASLPSCSLPGPQARGARLVGVTSQRGSTLESLCHLSVHLPLERELCPFDLAPVTSTAIQMIFGDTVAIALMQVSHPL